MLDFADLVVLNKFEKRGAEDALRDVRKQWRRNRVAFADRRTRTCPVFPTIASQFNDPGVNWLFAALCRAAATTSWRCRRDAGRPRPRHHAEGAARHRADSRRSACATSPRSREQGRGVDAQHRSAGRSRATARRRYWQSLRGARRRRAAAGARPLRRRRARPMRRPHALARAARALQRRARRGRRRGRRAAARLAGARRSRSTDDEYSYTVRGSEIRGENYTRVAVRTSRSRRSRRRRYRRLGRAARASC